MFRRATSIQASSILPNISGEAVAGPRVAGPVRLQADAPAMLVILPASVLSPVVTALLAQPATWSV